jgi:hypothetical protein
MKTDRIDRLASFEASLREAPQDEDIAYPMKDRLMVRSTRGVRLEPRATAMQPMARRRAA